MNRFKWRGVVWTSAVVIVCLLAAACKKEDDDKWRTPSAILGKGFLRVPAGEDDPGDNGPDDSTMLETLVGKMGPVQFSHFTHSSNSSSGYGIPCTACHHNVLPGVDPDFGCGECHQAPDVEHDPAHTGPDDNMLLYGKTQDLTRLPPVLFNHFSHASNWRLKIACESCHHKDAVIAPCADCHQEREVRDGDQVVVRRKRAFHQQCKSCHEALRQKDPHAAAPTECKECHRWRTLADAEGILTLERAYHQSCIGCHIQRLAENPKTKAPVRNCDGCHAPLDADAAQAGAEAADAAAPAPAAPVEPSLSVGDPNVVVDTSKDDRGREFFVIDHMQKNQPPTPFNHHEHQDYAEPCSKCHHEKVEMPAVRAACRNCHGDGGEMKDIYHRMCIRCHVENGAESTCRTCHPKG